MDHLAFIAYSVLIHLGNFFTTRSGYSGFMPHWATFRGKSGDPLPMYPVLYTKSTVHTQGIGQSIVLNSAADVHFLLRSHATVLALTQTLLLIGCAVLLTCISLDRGRKFKRVHWENANCTQNSLPSRPPWCRATVVMTEVLCSICTSLEAWTQFR